jgi:disulfide bond formation protein DsbB
MRLAALSLALSLGLAAAFAPSSLQLASGASACIASACVVYVYVQGCSFGPPRPHTLTIPNRLSPSVFETNRSADLT